MQRQDEVVGSVVRLGAIICRSSQYAHGPKRRCKLVPTLVVHVLARLAVRRRRLVVGVHVVPAVLWQRLLDAGRRRRVLCRLVADRGQLHGASGSITRRGLGAIGGRRLGCAILCGSRRGLPLSFLFSLPLGLLLLLPCLPFLSDFLEFYAAAIVSKFSFARHGIRSSGSSMHI